MHRKGPTSPAILLLTSALAAALICVAGSPASDAADTGNAAPQVDRIVGEAPASFTPHVMDGAVVSMTKVGNWVVVGGTFTRVRNSGSSVDIERRNLFAFDATTGIVSGSFAPNPNATVYKVQAAPDGTSVYVGGNFTTVTSRGVSIAVNRLYRARVSDGSRVDAFQAGAINGQVRDISVTGSRLWVAGKFTQIQGRTERALASLDATTGSLDRYFTGTFAGVHNGGTTNVLQIATSPDNKQLVAVGNFDTVNGVKRHQFVVLEIGSTTYKLANFYTTLFESSCSANFETYLTDVEYSPDGQFFVVSTTGAYGGGTASNAGTSGCDVVARFESGDSGTSVLPTWTAYTGGDTTWSVEITSDVIYVGGHQRWQNNPSAGDRVGPGAVSRPGIAALNPTNGMPYTCNPTRSRGVGVKDMIATEVGLFVGSDTEVFGGQTRRRVAFVPLSAGKALPQIRPHSLPNQIYRVDANGSQLFRRVFDGVQSSDAGSLSGANWSAAVGAFTVDGQLYTAFSNGSFTKRSFDGQAFGVSHAVDAADQLALQETWHNIDLPSITSLFYSEGYIYFTKSGQNTLFRRAFETESDVVGQQRFSMPAPNGLSYSNMRGAFVADGSLYFATTNGSLYRADWTRSGPVANSAILLNGAGTGWSSKVLFPYQGDPATDPPMLSPIASFTMSCNMLVCTFDGTGSRDPDGDITNYRWAFGDGGTTTGAVVQHEYSTGGNYQVTLTVTDNSGMTGTQSRTASPSVSNPLQFVSSTSTVGNRINHSVGVPDSTRAGDLLVLFFVANTTTPSYTGPLGWSQIATTAGGGTAGRAYAKIATTADINTTVAVTSSAYAKDATTLAVYRGVDTGEPIAAASAVLQTSSTTAHTTPPVTAPSGGRWLLSHWADETATTTTWDLPGAVRQRSTATGTGGGRISAVHADSNGPLPAGQQGSLTATANSAGPSVSFSVLINPK